MNEIALAATPALGRATQPWFVIQLKSNADALAKRNLLRQGVKIFAPFEELTVSKVGRFSQVRKPLFPGYLFASFDHDVVRWRTVNGTLGVSRLVSITENHPAQVPPGLIASLMRRCDPSGKLLPPSLLRGGDGVRVTNGPFADFMGTVEQATPDQRIWVLLDILGKSTRVAIRSADLRRVG